MSDHLHPMPPMSEPCDDDLCDDCDVCDASEVEDLYEDEEWDLCGAENNCPVYAGQAPSTPEG